MKKTPKPEGPLFDKIGQEIKPGCYIAYGHALGRCAGLRIGVVLAAGYKSIIGWDDKEKWEERITVWGVDDDWDHQESKLLSKRSTLMFPDRIVVLSSLPEKFTKLLDTVKDTNVCK